ncbi:MAG TPA: NAD-dependent epimerase/dehydratase family protein [Bryobacteraceae bacterium]|jgi:CDP-paratose 2-epimerase|nr:NAD-dependent epimerase/dehydratase family protein [Bryobacteraceae bacterium]
MESRYILITGGAGFVGTNVARSYLEQDQPVHILDNLSRPGVERNISELQEGYPGRVLFTQADVREQSTVKQAVRSARLIYHFAAQVAVTTSLADPAADAATNLGGTLNILEAVRALSPQTPVLFTSTNKVYGGLRNVPLCERGARYQPLNAAISETGVNEQQALDFLSPYGCSKGSADQYVLDYAHSFGLSTVVFRMSCIYGPYQLGSEDQGWVAHFLRRAAKGESITLYGDGRQVRDLLFVSDLVRAMRLAMESIQKISGHAFNIGGGASNSASLLEVLSQIKILLGSSPRVEWGPERLGDQRWYVSDIAKISRAVKWIPQITVSQGLSQLLDWYSKRPEMVEQSRMQVA